MVPPDGRKIATNIVATTMEWLDVETAKHTVNECLAFARKATRILNEADLSEMKPKDISQMIAYTVKALDEAARLTQYSQGPAENRSELTIGQLFAVLTNEEIAALKPALQRLQSGPDTGELTRSQLH